MTDHLRALAGDLSLAAVRLKRQLRVRRDATEVTLTQLSVLTTLDTDGAMAPGSLAARERVQPPSMTRVVTSLQNLGLISRTPHATDGRQVLIDLTDRGRKVVAADAHARERWLSTRLDTLTDEQLRVLRDSVDIMTSIVSEKNQDHHDR